MKTLIVAKQVEVTEKMKELFDKKLSKFDKFFGKDTEAVIKLSRAHGMEKLELTITVGSTIFRAEETDETFQNALDKAMDVIERQIRKNKTRLQKRFRSGDIGAAVAEIPDSEDETAPVIKVKAFELQPMTPDEAIMQMNLLEHTFYMFLNDETSKVSVIYKRNDGGYGLIEPK